MCVRVHQTEEPCHPALRWAVVRHPMLTAWHPEPSLSSLPSVPFCLLMRLAPLPPHRQIASTVIGGGRLEVPPLEELPGPGGGALPGLDAYLALMRDCWKANPTQRPSFADIVPRLRWAAGRGRARVRPCTA